MIYREEDFLLLSGLQHFKFCRRQWALIHIEQQWAENFRTTDGRLMHRKAHEKGSSERRGDLLILRSLPVFSASLGVSGECDVVEFRQTPNGIALSGQDGLWQPYPVEYKRGKYNERAGDLLQLCGQAMCLEEMLCCTISEGALYYGEPRRRLPVSFTEELRQKVRNALEEMHELYRRGYTPKVRTSKSCNACSLKELCLPKLMGRSSVAKYLEDALEGSP